MKDLDAETATGFFKVIADTEQPLTAAKPRF